MQKYERNLAREIRFNGFEVLSKSGSTGWVSWRFFLGGLKKLRQYSRLWKRSVARDMQKSKRLKKSSRQFQVGPKQPMVIQMELFFVGSP